MKICDRECDAVLVFVNNKNACRITDYGVKIEEGSNTEVMLQFRESQKYDNVEVLNYAIKGIKDRIGNLKFKIEENFDEISHLMNLKEALEKELEEISGNGKA